MKKLREIFERTIVYPKPAIKIPGAPGLNNTRTILKINPKDKTKPKETVYEGDVVNIPRKIDRNQPIKVSLIGNRTTIRDKKMIILRNLYGKTPRNDNNKPYIPYKERR